MSLIPVLAFWALPFSAMTGRQWSDHVHATLARARLKHGEARDRVIDLLAGQPCALSAVEIEDQLRSQGRATGRATIYRVLELLAEHGLLERLEVGDGITRFERAQPGGHHHHHLVCEHCGRLVAFDDAGLERAIARLSDRLGVRVESHDVLLRGDCGRCN
jgi:Fur family transcriptional regulator, ferric uptake regulator